MGERTTETTKIPEEFVNHIRIRDKPKKSKDDEYTAKLRSEASDLAERKEINYTVAKIKRASRLNLKG